MKAQRKTTPATNRKGRRAAPKLAVADAIKIELAPISGPVIVAGTDIPEPVAEIVNLPTVIMAQPLDVSVAVEAMSCFARPSFAGLDLIGLPTLAALAALVLKLALVAII